MALNFYEPLPVGVFIPDPLLPTPTTETSPGPMLARSNVQAATFPAVDSVFQIDVNADFDGFRHPLIVVNNAAVRQKIMNVLTVIAGEEHFEPLWGSFIQYRLFEPVIPFTASAINGDTISSLTSFMSETIQVLHNLCSVTELDDESGYAVDIYYQDTRTRVLDGFKFHLMARGLR